MNSKFQALRALKAYGADGAIRIILIGLFFNTLLPLYSQSTVGLADSDQLSTFSEVRLPGDATSTATYASLEALWEMDMSQAGDGDGRNDANQNNHNLFVIDDIVYVYVEKYKTPGQSITLRRFDAATGEELEELCSDFSGGLTDTSFRRYVMNDDAGHIGVVGLKAFPPGRGLAICIQVYDRQLQPITTITHAFEDAINGNYLRQEYEWMVLAGDLLSGDFKLTVGAWHCWGDAMKNEFYPSRFTLVFSKASPVPEIEVSRYDNDKYEFETRPNSSSGTLWNGMLFTTEVNNDTHLIQGFGTINEPLRHSPILLCKNKGELHDVSCSVPYPIFNQVDLLTNPELVSSDSHCFGVFPVKVGNETFLVLPYSRNETDGTVFKVAYWGELSSFSSLTPLWKFPESRFPYTPDNAKYETLRPKVVTLPGKVYSSAHLVANDRGGGDNTTFVAYMPSSILGAYRISLLDEPVASGATTIQEDTVSPAYTLCDGKLCFSPIANPANVKVVSMSGVIVMSIVLPANESSTISLENLPKGIYILDIDRNPHKITLR